MRLNTFEVWERGVLSAAIGTGTLQLLPIGLSIFGQLRPIPIRISLAVLTLVLAPDVLRIATRFIRELPARGFRSASTATLVWWSLFLLFMGFLLVRALTLGELGDDDGIHLSAPRRWLQAGTLSYLPTYSLTNATLGFDMVYLIALATWSPVGAKMLHYSAGVFALFGLALCARRIVNGRGGTVRVNPPVHDIVSMLAVSVLLIATPFGDLSYLFGNAMVDLAACWMAMMTVLLWLVWRQRPDWKILICMGLCAGFAASYKLTCVQIAIAWVPILVAESRLRRETWWNTLVLITVFGAMALAPVIPWFVRNTLLTGNPLYPMLSSLIPTRDWPAAHALVFSQFARYYSWGLAAGSRLGESERKGLVLLTEVLVVVGGAAMTAIIRNRIERSLIVFATLFTLISVILTGLIFRYWLPATMCVVLVVGVVCVERAKQWSQQLRWAAVLLLVIAIAAQTRRQFTHSAVGFQADLRMATGRTSFEQEYADSPFVSVWKYINLNTPPDAKVLLGAFYTSFGAASYGGFWVDRMCYTTDSHTQAYFPLDDWASFEGKIAEAGITHIVVSDQQFNPDRRGFSFTAGQNEYPFVRRLAEEHGEKIYQAKFLQVFRLRAADTTADRFPEAKLVQASLRKAR